MHLIHIAVGTLCAVIGYILGIYFPLMPMQFLIMGGITYHSIIAQYKRQRAAELQAILDDQQCAAGEAIEDAMCQAAVSAGHIKPNPELAAAFERMQAKQ